MVTKGQVLKYTLLPGILPRIAELFRSGFVHVAYLIALIYSSVRLLPPNHPYLDHRNIGRFGIRHVIAEASNNLVMNRNNIDQIIIYFTILIGLILLLGQFAVLIFGIIAFSNPAIAAIPTSSLELFANPSNLYGSQGPLNDIALMILDLSFGVSGIFDSCISIANESCTAFRRAIGDAPGTLPTEVPISFQYPTAVHGALHNMLEFYSYGIFIIAIMVIIYYVITVTAETATTGTPFGQRFNKVWAPIRIIVFLALIIPLQTNQGTSALAPGLNMGQIITLKVAQTGSNLASNAWAYFNGGGKNLAGPINAGTTLLTQQKKMIARPETQLSAVSEIIQFMHLAKTCAAAYNTIAELDEDGNATQVSVQPYLIRSRLPSRIDTANRNTVHLPFLGTDFNAALEFFVSGNMTLRFGQAPPSNIDPEQWGKKKDRFQSSKGNIIPYCGDLTLPINDVSQPGAIYISQGMYNMLRDMWGNDDIIRDSADCIVQKYGLIGAQNVDLSCNDGMNQSTIDTLIASYGSQYEEIILQGIAEQEAQTSTDIAPEYIKMGWVGASLYYNQIAEMNGAITAASMNMPFQAKLPFLLEYALIQNKLQNANLSESGQFDTKLSDPTAQNTMLKLKDPNDYKRLSAMRVAFLKWDSLGYSKVDNFMKPSGNAIKDFLNIVLGTNGLFEMRNNMDVHPMAKLSALGKGMMDNAVRNLAIGVGGAVGSNLLGIFDSFTKEAVKAISGFLLTIGVATIGIAAVLYFVLPLLPFIYFFFAVSGWVKSIFEAIVAMPLWALAHIRIDGEGLPGPGATNGYFLLLEIFLRPILILIGFIAGISVFAAFISTLDFIFDLVVVNVGGFGERTDALIASGAHSDAGILNSMTSYARGPIDEFMFTVIYTAICYMMALACFKLVDQIPNKILRWAGVSVATFQENAGDPASQLSNQVYKGSLLIGNQIKGTAQSDLAILTSSLK